MRLLILAALLALSACAPPMYLGYCHAIDDHVLGCMFKPVDKDQLP